jgi:hypothetical protein
MSAALGLLFFAIATLTTGRNTTAYETLPVYTTQEETPQTRLIVDSEKDVLLDVPFVHQLDDLPKERVAEIRATACGPASLAMVFNYLGTEVSLWDVIEGVPPSVYVRGSMFYKLFEGPSYFNYSSVQFKNDPKAIFEHLKNERPIIMNIQNYDAVTGHAIVVVGMKGFNGTSAESLIAHDPYVEGYRVFRYINDWTLLQPEGIYNYIGHQDPFYLEL